MITTMIDHTSTDLWIVSTGAKYFEDLSLLNTRMRAASWRSKACPKSFRAWWDFGLEPAGWSHDVGGRRRNNTN